MPSVEELLNQDSGDEHIDISPINDVITIDPETRTINLPASETLFGTEQEMNVERKYFKCPKIVGDNIDLSKHQIYITYVTAKDNTGTFLPEEELGLYYCEDMAVDGDYITFSWLLSENVLRNHGFIAFAVSAKHMDGEVLKTRWKTKPAVGTVLLTVPDGDGQIVEAYPDIITQLLERMDEVEAIATPEAMQNYVETYLVEHPVVPTDEQASEGINNWLDEHPEATTTVQDGSIEEVKLTDDLKKKTIKDYVTPEMFGAVGDGVSDDTEAFNLLSEYLTDKKSVHVVLCGHYKIYSQLKIAGCGTVIVDGIGAIDKFIANYDVSELNEVVYFYNTKECIVRDITIRTYVDDVTLKTTKQSRYYAVFVTAYDDNEIDSVIIENVTYVDGFNVINADKKPYNGSFGVSGYFNNGRVKDIKILNNTIINGCGRIIYCTECSDIVISGNNLINIGYNPNNFEATAGNIVFREISSDKICISDNNVIMCSGENIVGETHVFELNRSDSTSGGNPISNLVANNNAIDMGSCDRDSSCLRIVCAEFIKISNNIFKCRNACFINTRTVEEENRWNDVVISNNHISSEKNNMFSNSGYWKDGCNSILLKENYFSINENAKYILIQDSSFIYNGFTLVDNFLHSLDSDGIVSQSPYSMAQKTYGMTFYNGKTKDVIKDGVLTIPYGVNCLRLAGTLDSIITISSIVFSSGEIQDGFILSICADLNGDNIKFYNGFVLALDPITLGAYGFLRIVYDKQNNRWYRIG